MRMRLPALLLLCSLAIAGGAAAKTKKKELWFDAFPAYPGARLLCTQHITGNDMHIEWRSYATRHDVARVVAFYERGTGQKARKNGSGGSTWVAGAEKVLAVHPAGGGHPTCEVSPKKGEKTV